jgi:hypothetical protein
MILREIRSSRLIAAHFVHVRHTSCEAVPIFAELNMKVNFCILLKLELI